MSLIRSSDWTLKKHENNNVTACSINLITLAYLGLLEIFRTNILPKTMHQKQNIFDLDVDVGPTLYSLLAVFCPEPTLN